MKKVLSIAVLFCFATAPMMMGQSNGLRVPNGNGTIKGKSDPAYSMPQNMRDKQLMNDERRRKGETLPTMDRSKTHMTDPKVQMRENNRAYKESRNQDNKSPKVVNQQNVNDKKPSDGKKVFRAKKLMDKAQEKRDMAKREYDALMEKQQQERAKFNADYDKAVASGAPAEQLRKLEKQKTELDTKHARQTSAALEAIDKASKEYEAALGYYEDMRN